MNNVVGSVGLCNVASLNVYEVNDGEEFVVAGINDSKPTKRKLYFNTKGVYFNFGGSRYYLHEIMRTSI